MKASSATSDRTWTILDLLKWTTAYFNTHAIDNPRSTAEILLCHVLGGRRIDLYLQYDRPMNRDELKTYKTLIKRRLDREPVAYIVGSKEFWSLDFKVNQDVLIPRPETECLVEASLAVMESRSGSGPLRVLELGTGSGAVTVALSTENPQHVYFASDRSLKALRVAAQNSTAHGRREGTHFFAGDWFSPLQKTSSRFDLIVSNPPYIPKEEIRNLQPEIHQYEPLEALDGDMDGLGDLRRIIEKAPEHLRPSGHLLLEIGYGQKDPVTQIAEENGRYECVSFLKDYSGIDRIAKFSCPAAHNPI